MLFGLPNRRGRTGSCIDFLQGKEIPILLLSEYEIPDDTELSETVTAVQVEFSEQRYLRMIVSNKISLDSSHTQIRLRRFYES